jgi:hypothetical protein
VSSAEGATVKRPVPITKGKSLSIVTLVGKFALSVMLSKVIGALGCRDVPNCPVLTARRVVSNAMVDESFVTMGPNDPPMRLLKVVVDWTAIAEPTAVSYRTPIVNII